MLNQDPMPVSLTERSLQQYFGLSLSHRLWLWTVKFAPSVPFFDMVRWLLLEGWKKSADMADANAKRELVLSATLDCIIVRMEECVK